MNDLHIMFSTSNSKILTRALHCWRLLKYPKVTHKMAIFPFFLIWPYATVEEIASAKNFNLQLRAVKITPNLLSFIKVPWLLLAARVIIAAEGIAVKLVLIVLYPSMRRLSHWHLAFATPILILDSLGQKLKNAKWVFSSHHRILLKGQQ